MDFVATNENDGIQYKWRRIPRRLVTRTSN